jgi:hypothetical protein
MTEPEDMRSAWLRLAELLAGAPNDEAAASLFRAVTGLSGTDPEADRAELARRVAADRNSSRAAAPADPWASDNDQAPAEFERSCGCLSRGGVFLPCYDHIDSDIQPQ